jgi:hypothetical protein
MATEERLAAHERVHPFFAPLIPSLGWKEPGVDEKARVRPTDGAVAMLVALAIGERPNNVE